VDSRDSASKFSIEADCHGGLLIRSLPMTADIDTLLKGLGNLTGVIGTMVMNSNGLPIRTSFKDAEAIHYAAFISEFLRKVRVVLEPVMGAPIDVIRVRSHKNEIIIAPSDVKSDIILVVVQDASAQA
jgi:dynein light chain roadblock-type